MSKILDYPPIVKGYKYERFLGAGAFGTVCLYQKGDSKVAIKLESTSQQIQVLTNESLTLKKLQAESLECIP